MTAMLAFAGCSNRPAASGASGAVTDFVPEDQDPSGVLAAIGIDASMPTTLHAAMQASRTSCMRDLGFSYTAPDLASPAGARRAATERNLTFGLPSSNPATAIGLQSTNADYVADVDRVQRAQYAQDTAERTKGEAYFERWSAALFGVNPPTSAAFGGNGRRAAGVSDDGCIGKSYAAVFGTIPVGLAIEMLPSMIRNEIVEAVYASADVGPLVSRWATCMQSALGTDVSTPRQVFAWLESQFDPTAEGYKGEARVAALELAVVRALKRCDDSTGLYEHGWSETLRQAPETLNRYAPEIAEFRTALRQAERIVRTG